VSKRNQNVQSPCANTQTKEDIANFLDAQVLNNRIGTPKKLQGPPAFIASDKASYSGASLN
jgi:hypothetical protein